MRNIIIVYNDGRNVLIDGLSAPCLKWLTACDIGCADERLLVYRFYYYYYYFLVKVDEVDLVDDLTLLATRWSLIEAGRV